MPEPTASRRDDANRDVVRPELARAVAGAGFREVRWFRSLDSTNRYLVDEAAAGTRPGLVVVADEQSAGRGRLGRTWVAPPGASLLVSVLVEGGAPAEERHLVLLAAALAAVDAVDELCGFRPRLKWPNDLVVGDRKLGGLLAEAATDAIVVGMGLNVDWDSFPSELEETATACNREGRPVPRAELLVAWLRGLDRRLRALAEGGPAAIHADQVAASATIGRRVRVERARDVLEGEYRRLEAEYAGGDVPLPPFWGGFRVVPDSVELWMGRPNRLHDRLRYSRRPDGSWAIERLSP